MTTTRRKTRRVFLLGLDGAAFSLTRRWMENDTLPNFSRLQAEGAFGLLRSLPAPNSAAAWTSIITGVNPGRHGVTDFYVPAKGTYDIRFLCGRDRKFPAFWQRASHLRYVIMNVPMTYPSDPVNGVMISGLDAPSPESEGFCSPREILREIQSAVGPYILHPGIISHCIEGDVDEGLASLKEAFERHVATTLYLMRHHPWDCMMVVLSTLDLGQHCFWKYFDSSHPLHNPTDSEKYGGVIHDLYQQVDAAVGEILAELPQDCLFMIVSDHGAGPKHSATHQLNDWLHTQGLLSYRNTGQWKTRWIRRIYSLTEHLLSRERKDRLLRLLPNLRNRVRTRMAYANLDWEGTKVYADAISPALRVNLRGREPMGTVEPGEEMERLLDYMREIVTSLTDANGNPLVAEVIYSRDVYSGPYAQQAPDLFIRWNEEQMVSVVHSDLPAPSFPTEEFRVVSGDHHPDGIIALWGRGVRAGTSLRASLYDVTPTVLAALGQGAVSDGDGRLLEEAFCHPLASCDSTVATPFAQDQDDAPTQDFTSEEESQLRQRLRGLGYVE